MQKYLVIDNGNGYYLLNITGVEFPENMSLQDYTEKDLTAFLMQKKCCNEIHRIRALVQEAEGVFHSNRLFGHALNEDGQEFLTNGLKKIKKKDVKVMFN